MSELLQAIPQSVNEMELINEQTPGCPQHTKHDSGLEAVGPRVPTQLSPASSLPIAKMTCYKSPTKGIDQMPRKMLPHRGSDSSLTLSFCSKVSARARLLPHPNQTEAAPHPWAEPGHPGRPRATSWPTRCRHLWGHPVPTFPVSDPGLL